MENSDKYEAALKSIQDIEAELKCIIRWSAIPPAAEKFIDMGAFGSKKMPFEQWLQFVLIPKVKAIINSAGSFPSSSSVSAFAYRTFDGDAETEALCNLLAEFDVLFN
jgi:uncharacterized protein YqcC (DUF446 family)